MKAKAIKAVSFILFLILIICCYPVSALAGNEPCYTLTDKTVVVGDEFEIPVAIQNNPGIISNRLKVYFDSEYVSLISVEDTQLLNGFTSPSPTVSSPYTLRWADSLVSENNTSNGTIVVLKFKALKQVANTVISVEHNEARNVNGTKITFLNASSNIVINSEATPKYSVENKTVNIGDEFVLRINLQNNPGITSDRFKIYFDNTYLSLISYRDCELLNGFTSPSPTLSSPYTLRWADSLATENNTNDGVLIELTFVALQETENTPISVEHIEARNATGSKIVFEDAICNIAINEESEPVITDDSALVAALVKANSFDSEDYSEESYNALQQVISQFESLSAEFYPQEEIDNAVCEILTAISNLNPYLNLIVNSTNGTISVITEAKNQTDSEYSVLFGNEIDLYAVADSGYEFLGWYETTSNRILSREESYSFIITTNTNIEAIFIPVQSASIYFMNDSGYIAAIVSKTIEEWNAVTTISDLLPEVPYKYGSTNGHWSYVESYVIGNLQSGSDVDVIAVYDDIVIDRPDIPVYSDSIPSLLLFYDYDAENSTASFIMSAGIPDGCEVESIGIAFYYENANSFDPTYFDININNKMLTSKFEATNGSDHYIVDIPRFNSYYNWAVKGYVTYYDAEGNLKIAYTNQINIVDTQEV